MPTPIAARDTLDVPVARQGVAIRAWPIAAIVGLLTFSLFSRLLWSDSGFVSIGDPAFVTQNGLVANPSWRNVRRCFRDIVGQSNAPTYYQPLTMASLMLDGWVCQSLNIDDASVVFHAHSALLHALNAMLVFVLFRRLGISVLIAGAAALMFGVHPAVVEPVAWVAQRGLLLASFFALLSLLAYLRTGCGPRWAVHWRLLSLLLFALALLARPTLYFLPAAFVALDYWPLRRVGWGVVREKAPAMVLTAMAMLLIPLSHGAPTADSLFHPGAILTDTFAALSEIADCLCGVLIPINLAPTFPADSPRAILWPRMLIVLVLIACILQAAWRWRQQAPVVLVSVIVAFSLAVPSFILPMEMGRGVYLSLAFLLLPAAAGAERLLHSPRFSTPGSQRLAVMCGACIVIVLSVGSFVQILHWRGSYHLFTHAMRVRPECLAYKVALADWYTMHGRAVDAIPLLRDAVTRQPAIPHNRFLLANALGATEQIDEAIMHYRVAIEAMPDRPDFLQAYGGALFKARQYEEAAAAFEKAAPLDPDSAVIRAGLGHCYLKLHKPAAAREQFTLALLRRPSDAMTHFGLAAAWAGMDVPELAASHLQAAIAQDTAFSGMAWSEPALRRLENLPEFAGLVVKPDGGP